jgi:hypothetical protein
MSMKEIEKHIKENLGFPLDDLHDFPHRKQPLTAGLTTGWKYRELKMYRILRP